MVGGTLVVVVGQQLEVRVGGVQRPHTGLAGQNQAFVVDVGEGRAVTIGDVQIELRDQLVVLLDDVAGDAQSIKAINAVGDLADLGDLAIGDVQLARRNGGRHGIAGAFIGDGEEQAILDDRAGDLRGVDLRFEIADAQHAAGVVATQLVRIVIGTAQSGEAVGTRLQLGVDGAALEEALADIHRRHFHREFADGIQRHRAAGGNQAAGFEAEGVAKGHAVHGETVETVVLAGNRDGPAVGGIDVHQRIAGGQVADVAVDVGHAGDVARGQHGGSAGADGDGAALAGGRHGDGATGRRQHDFHALRRAGHQAVQRVGGSVIARGFDGDAVGAAEAQAGGVEFAVGARGLHDAGARRGVDHGHSGASDRLRLFIDDRAANGRRGFLGLHGGRQNEGRNGKRGKRNTKTKMTHVKTPWGWLRRHG